MYVNNGININELQKNIDKTEKINHPFTVFTLGRICYQKDPTLFNEIAKQLSDIRFIWIGDGELRNELNSSNIEVTGWVDRMKAIKYAVNADVFILPSRWEGLPISLLEAMYMKKICIVSNVIGNRDVIINNYNGFICLNADDFIKKIKTVRINDFDSVVENAHDEILKKYNTQIMASEYKDIYENSLL